MRDRPCSGGDKIGDDKSGASTDALKAVDDDARFWVGSQGAGDPVDCIAEEGDDLDEGHVLYWKLEMEGGVPRREIYLAWHDGEDVGYFELAEDGRVGCGVEVCEEEAGDDFSGLGRVDGRGGADGAQVFEKTSWLG